MERAKFNLLLKEIVEGLAGVAGTRNMLGGNRWPRHGSRRGGVFFNGGAKFVELAIVLLVLARDAFRNRLHAFKSRGRIEIGALLAGMQLERALRALAFGVETRLQNGAAIRASRARDGAHHARRARSNLFLSGMAFGRPFLFFLGLFGTHVAPLLILPIQGNLRGRPASYAEPDNETQINLKLINYFAKWGREIFAPARRHLTFLFPASKSPRKNDFACQDSRAHSRARPSAGRSSCKNFCGAPRSERIASAAR
jgi:hypothetical protein